MFIEARKYAKSTVPLGRSPTDSPGRIPGEHGPIREALSLHRMQCQRMLTSPAPLTQPTPKWKDPSRCGHRRLHGCGCFSSQTHPFYGFGPNPVVTKLAAQVGLGASFELR